MIQIFDIKKKKKYLNDNNVTLLDKYKKISNLSSDELVQIKMACQVMKHQKDLKNMVQT